MKEVLDSLTTTLRERLVSPLAGAFIVSWLIINYKVVVVLTSGMKPHVKFPYIEDVIWRDSYGLWMNSLVYPAIAALLYILIYPWPARWLLKYSLYQQNITKLMKITVEGNHPVTREELEEAKQKWAEKFRKQGEAIQRLEVQIEDEQKRADELVQAEQKMTSRANQLSADLVKAQTGWDKAQAENDDLRKTIADLTQAVAEKNSQGDDAVMSVIKRSRSDNKDAHEMGASQSKGFHDDDFDTFSDHVFLRDGLAVVHGSSGMNSIPMHAVYNFSLLLREAMKGNFPINRVALERLTSVIGGFEGRDADEVASQISSGKVDIDRFSEHAMSSFKRCFEVY